MSKRKWYAKAVYLLVALAMTVGLLMGPSVAASGPVLGISVDPDSGSIFCGDSENLTVEVCNTGDYAQEVVVKGEVVDGPGILTPPEVDLGGICEGCCNEATFDLECTGIGNVTVNFTATAACGATVTKQVIFDQICRFDVEITAPKDGATVDVSDTFGVAANITNNTDEYCRSLEVTLDIDGNAERVGGSASYNISLAPNTTEEVNWTVHCTDKGEVTFTVTAVGCEQDGLCAELCADTVTIVQVETYCDAVCNFTYEILPPAPRCDEDICVCDNFSVKVLVTNTGNECAGNISGKVEMHATGDAEPVGGNQRDFGPIAVGGNQTLTFTWHCYNATDNCEDQWQSAVSFEARAWGHCNPEGQDPIYLPTGTQYWSNYWHPAAFSDPHYINQTWIDLKMFDDFEDGDLICTCQDYCDGDDILVYPEVTNCDDTRELRNVEVLLGNVTGSIEQVGSKTSIYIGQIPADGSVRSDEAFHFQCTGCGEAFLTFKAIGVFGEVETVCDIDVINLHQKEKPTLEVELTADDCQQYCDNFNVTALISNTGANCSSPIAINTTNDIDFGWSGSVTNVSAMKCDCGADGVIELDPGDSCTCEWEFHCSGDANAHFWVTVNGTSACGNVTANDTVDVEQIQLDVEIITPEDCDTKEVSETFCVTANITDNDCDTCFSGLNAVISFPDGKADIEDGENYAKGFNLSGGDTQQVSWSVHCLEPGDTDIKVEVTGCASAEQDETSSANCTCTKELAYCDCCELHDKYDIITIHQECELDLDMEIISPDNLDTFVATSQDFAVSAVIVNNEQLDVTVTELGLMYHPESGATIVTEPQAGFVIPGGGSERVTWTMHCEEPGLLTMMAYATAVDEVGCPGEVWTCPLALWQYPAASLDVDILSVEPDTTVTVCQNFTVFYQVNNTGAADATDVVAELSVTPGGSARPVAGNHSGYTQRIGTIPAGGTTGVLEWNLHCKQACESNIVITAEGNDEYGWHKKQECQSTGNFIIEEGYEYFEVLETPDTWWEWVVRDGGAGEHAAWSFGYFEGEASGLIGPFNFDSDVQFAALGGGPDYFGHITGMGVVMPNLFHADGKDVLAWVGHIKLDPYFTGLPPISDRYEVYGGLIQVINGNLNGVYLKENGGPPWEVGLLNGTYCSTMAKEALRPINPDFIESDTVTVKQLEPAQLVVEIDFPYEGFRTDATEEYKVTATITNIGEETGENVSITLSVDDYADILSLNPPMQDIAGGDSVSVTWEVECTEAGFSVFTANATGTGAISGNAVEAFDTVTVKQGEVPLAQLVVEISYPENGDEFIEGDQFPVTAWIENVGERTAELVEVSIDISANAENVSGPSGTWPKKIAPTSSVATTWTVNCTAAGFSVITVEAAGNSTENACNTAVDVVTIKQVSPPKPYLVVDLSAPANVIEDDTFVATAVITNIGLGDATPNATGVTMTANGPASPATNTTSLPAIVAGNSVKVEFELTCTGPGGVNVAVQAEGGNTNVAIDSAAVMQKALDRPYLWVELSAPAEVVEGDKFQATAVVTNIGDKDATAGTATVTAVGPASPASNSTTLPDILAGNSVKLEFELTCTGSGGVNVAVAAEGGNTNTAIDSVAVMQIGISPYLTVDLTAPAQIYEAEEFTVTAVVSNIGDADSTQDISVDMTASGLVWPLDDSKTIAGGLHAGDSAVVEFDLVCTDEGGVNVYVEAWATDTNTAADSAAVQQIDVPVGAPALTVDVVAPAQVYVGDGYNVTAVVSNIGDADAAGVEATLAINGPASTTESLTKAIGGIAAGSSDSVTWDLTCTGAGGVTVTVTAVGTDTNTAVGAAAIQQGVMMWDNLVVIPTSGYAALDITASAEVSNSGNMATTTEAELKVDGDVVASEIISLGAGAGRIVSFDYTLDAEMCEVTIYEVTIDGLPPVEVTVLPRPDVIWEYSYDHTALISPYPGFERPSLDVAADLVDVGCNTTWFQVLWFNEATGDWLTYFSEFTIGNTLHTLEPGEVYLVIVKEPGELTIPQC